MFPSSNFSGLVIDMGHSFTSVVPVFNNHVVGNSYRRLDIGGKLISKLMIDLISREHMDLSEYFYSANLMRQEILEYLRYNSLLEFKEQLDKLKSSEIYW